MMPGECECFPEHQAVTSNQSNHRRTKRKTHANLVALYHSKKILGSKTFRESRALPGALNVNCE